MSNWECNNVVEQPSKASDNISQVHETVQYIIQRNTHNNIPYWLVKRDVALQSITTNSWCNYR